MTATPARYRVLVADAISLDGLAPLRDDPRFELVNKPGLKGDDLMNATAAALVVICLMLLTKFVTWDDMLANKQAWNTLAWFATLVALADGLSRTGESQQQQSSGNDSHGGNLNSTASD